MRNLTSTEPIMEIEQFCEQIGKTAKDFIYLYAPPFPCRPSGLLVWGSGNIKSIAVDGEEQLAVEAIPIRALVNPYASLKDAQAAAKDGRLFASNIHMPSMKIGSQIIIISDAYCIIALCGVRRKGSFLS